MQIQLITVYKVTKLPHNYVHTVANCYIKIQAGYIHMQLCLQLVVNSYSVVGMLNAWYMEFTKSMLYYENLHVTETLTTAN